ncbi:MAG: cardiolipin synthase [Gammaproteobacteria bacterium]|nr:cardiolipin synthase [Gammaproteobacteria bacterium]MDH4315375.1 cardiolipin synthase [Gammaproteobacteria bacterium]MDH5214620.1 cardiolipin synthase [Gammaproteobacteria bacterium]MDH5501378.1 cardiolipin synthase [Gammaproteobacteria bacterium]
MKHDSLVEALTEPSTLGLAAAIYALLQIAGIYAAIHAVFNARSSQGSTAWAIALISAPLIALPFYFVFGRNRFLGYVRSRRMLDSEHADVIRQVNSFCDGVRSTLPDARGTLRSLELLAHLPFTRGNKVRLLVDGEAAFEAIFEAIDSAKDYLLVQFFILRDDQLGRKLQQHLLRKVQDGVTVNVLFDEIGSHKLSGRYLRECRAGGIDIRPFRTTKGLSNRFQINFRNHRKIVVADGRIAFLGGLNVGDEYLGRNPRVGHWRDTFASVEGPAADALQLIFFEDWHWASGEVLDKLDWQVQVSGDADVLVVPGSPADRLETCNLMFVSAINSATKRFWIASPYFVPNDEVVAALQLAALRGVDVRILLPANPDHFLVYLASFSYMQRTGGNGIRFYRYTDGFMHQKTFLVDDIATGIGTANLDTRSFRLNFEITLLTIDRTLAEDVKAMFENDFQSSTLVRHDALEQRSFLFRLGAKGARLLSPIL